MAVSGKGAEGLDTAARAMAAELAAQARAEHERRDAEQPTASCPPDCRAEPRGRDDQVLQIRGPAAGG